MADEFKRKRMKAFEYKYATPPTPKYKRRSKAVRAMLKQALKVLDVYLKQSGERDK